MADADICLDNKTSTQLLGEGIRSYTISDFNGAVQYLSKASELVVAEHDEKHDSLGDIYLYYGKSLLEIAREESDPLGDAVVPRELDDDDCDDEDEEVDAVETADTGVEQDKPEEAKTNGKTESPEKDKKEVVQNGNDEAKEEDINKPGTSDDAAEGGSVDKPEDEPTDLQVAWEVLELAKLIFEKRGEEGKEDLAETLITLGEVSLESENFESAISDIKQGLEIQKSLYDKFSRKLAETYYKCGMALSTNSQIDEAIENFVLSLEYINNRIDLLEKDKVKNEDELKEIKSLVPEIEEKILDMKNYKEEAAKKARNELEQKPSASSPEKKANDITHLVKRKRKLEDIVEAAAGANPIKKPSP